MSSLNETKVHVSTECVDNADGLPGVIIYEDKTFPIPSQQDEETRMDCGPLETTSDSKASLNDEDTAMDWDSQDTMSNSFASVAPTNFYTEEEMEWEQQE